MGTDDTQPHNAYIHTSIWLYYKYAVSYLYSYRKGVHKVMFVFPPQCYAFTLLLAVHMLCLEIRCIPKKSAGQSEI